MASMIYFLISCDVVFCYDCIVLQLVFLRCYFHISKYINIWRFNTIKWKNHPIFQKRFVYVAKSMFRLVKLKIGKRENIGPPLSIVSECLI
jgi:hypothetical protein